MIMTFQKTVTTLTAILLFVSLSAQKPAFKFLKTGDVQPAGWLKIQIQQDAASGYARYMPQLTDRCRLDVYDVSKTDSMKRGSGGHQPERVFEAVSGQALDFQTSENKVQIEIPQFDFLALVVVEY